MKTVQITLTLHPATDAFISSEMLYTNSAGRTFRRRGGFQILDQTVSRQRLAVIALRRTLQKLKQPCKVYVTINSHYVWTNAEKLATWQHNTWLNASGKPIANAYSWQKLAQAATGHQVYVMYEDRAFHHLAVA